jgi:hypothetical protein
MKEIENLFKEYTKVYLNYVTPLCINKIEKFYIYSGYEITSFTGSFLKINKEIYGGAGQKYFPEITIESFQNNIGLKIRELKQKIEEKVQSLPNPPTHIKATYDVESDTTTFEYIYDQLLDEEKDNYCTIYYEWQYELGKPRPIPKVVPEGYHLEIHSVPVEERDEQGRIIKITTELQSVVVKDKED